MHANTTLIVNDTMMLRARGLDAKLSSTADSLYIQNLSLPGPGWSNAAGQSIRTTRVWIPLPPAFPVTLPGVGLAEPTHAFHTDLLLYNNSELHDLYECKHTRPHGWHWFCFQKLSWGRSVPHPLLALVELVEVSLSERASRTGRRS